MPEIIMGGVSMFLFKQGSRNALNNQRFGEEFRLNYLNHFGLRMPHMDTVCDLLRRLDSQGLADLKADLVSTLISKKVLEKQKLIGFFYGVAVDATGVFSVPEGHCEHCLFKTNKNGVKSYFHNVLEAKLLTRSGFAISIASEWIENDGAYEKQDCELKAFVRLSEKIKKQFPRLPICILADGLYPNKPFFDTCKVNHWRFIVTLKDGSLKSVWEEVALSAQAVEHCSTLKLDQKYSWQNSIDYRGQELSWVELVEQEDEKVKRFVYVTDLPVSQSNVKKIVDGGRLRFKIENEGFNAQKNSGFGMEHKYSRTSWMAMKNHAEISLGQDVWSDDQSDHRT
jgi:hypothetical protein